MFTYDEKAYLLELLKKQQRGNWFKKPSPLHKNLEEKLAQMIRNEDVNRNHLKTRL